MQDSSTGRRIVVLTGATRGIGKAIAQRFAGDGTSIIAVGRSEAGLAELAADLGDAFAGSVAGDVAGVETAQAVRQLADGLGGADVLINTAGVFPTAILADIDRAEAEAVMQTNFFGTMNFCQMLIPGMVERQRGSVVNISSLAARSPTPGLSVYAASKAAVEAFSRAIAAEAAPYVRINCLSPGPTWTETVEALVASDTTGAVDEVTRAIPMGRYGEVAEIADAVHFLATGLGARWMTGQTLQVNGGIVMS